MNYFHILSFTVIKTQTCSLCLPTCVLFDTICKDREFDSWIVIKDTVIIIAMVSHNTILGILRPRLNCTGKV